MSRRNAHRPPSTARPWAITDLVVVAGVLSAAIVALVDAATSGSRLRGDPVADRWFWMSAFAVSAVTVLAGIESSRDHATTGAVRALLGAAAILNLAVVVASVGSGAGAWPVASVYGAAAAGLATLAARGATRAASAPGRWHVTHHRADAPPRGRHRTTTSA